jgi:hypothetical protein
VDLDFQGASSAEISHTKVVGGKHRPGDHFILTSHVSAILGAIQWLQHLPDDKAEVTIPF